MSDTPAKKQPLYCDDLRSEPGFPGCCGPCHEEIAAGYSELMDHYVGELLTHRVCCRVSEWLDTV
jgi:hypothetical protein